MFSAGDHQYNLNCMPMSANSREEWHSGHWKDRHLPFARPRIKANKGNRLQRLSIILKVNIFKFGLTMTIPREHAFLHKITPSSVKSVMEA